MCLVHPSSIFFFLSNTDFHEHYFTSWICTIAEVYFEVYSFRTSIKYKLSDKFLLHSFDNHKQVIQQNLYFYHNIRQNLSLIHFRLNLMKSTNKKTRLFPSGFVLKLNNLSRQQYCHKISPFFFEREIYSLWLKVEKQNHTWDEKFMCSRNENYILVCNTPFHDQNNHSTKTICHSLWLKVCILTHVTPETKSWGCKKQQQY